MIPQRKLCRRWPALGCIATLIAFAATAAVAREVSFNRDIRPVLSDRCFSCHGPDTEKRKAKLRLDLATGKEGAYRSRGGSAALKPGDLGKSELWRRITTADEDDVMPPPKAKKKPLSAEEKQLIKSWIEAGAPYEDFWAFIPASLPKVPAVKNTAWSNQRIDLHVLQRLEPAGLKPSAEADKRTLIRRVSFDLTGLPPGRDELRAFLADKNPKAYENLVDRLLASQQYGEHMARYWLDLVRFADTNGNHKDFFRNTSSYRDWVIRAFNSNLGYDDFLRYQLAGDLFPDANGDQLAASGFNRLHLIIDKGTALPEESFFKNVVDRVTAVGTAFMGMSVHCASCHDHKYDPLTQKDFYSLFAFFNNIEAAPETNGGEKNGLQPPTARLGTAEQQKKLAEASAGVKKLDPLVQNAKKIALNEKDAKKKKQLMQKARDLVSKKNVLVRQSNELSRLMQTAMVMRERKTVRKTFLRKRGQYDDPGEEVARNTPAFLPPMKKKGETATRMDLAEWFVDRRNPLTARAAVNRFWQQFFGVGLVKTSEDLGSQGEPPSHPELIDYLAASFLDSGWDIKALVKEIVMSKTYRQSSVASPAEFKKDPENRLLARGSRFRLDAEMIRDQVLSTSGLLVNTLYGKSVKPPQPDGLWKAVTMIGERYRADKGDAIYRRSVYTYWKRGMPPPQMTILNAPIRDACVARRERTNTPSQALLLLNESEYIKAARNLARQALEQKKLSATRRIELIYETVTSKEPDAKERALLKDLVKDLETGYRKTPKLAEDICAGLSLNSAEEKAQLAAWTVLVNAIYNLDITKTRE